MSTRPYGIPKPSGDVITWIIFLFCLAGGFHSAVSLVRTLPYASTTLSVIAVETASLLLFASQTWMLIKRNRRVWVASLIQTIVYPLGVASTFGFFARYVVEPIFADPQSWQRNYAIFGVALVLEILKTLYLFENGPDLEHLTLGAVGATK
jgi:hypothetical protein